MKLSTILAVGSVMLVAATSSAQSVKLKKAWDKVDEENKAAAARVKEKCGSDLAIKVDQKSFDTVEAAEGPARWCANYADSVAYLCANDADYKAAVAKSIKTLTCVRDTKLPHEGSKDNYGNKFSLKGGVLECRYNENSANLDDGIRNFLKENL
jgi:hypothetical protein